MSSRFMARASFPGGFPFRLSVYAGSETDPFPSFSGLCLPFLHSFLGGRGDVQLPQVQSLGWQVVQMLLHALSGGKELDPGGAGPV